MDSHDDDLESLRSRIARREGKDGRQVALERATKEAEEIDRIVHAQKKGGATNGHVPIEGLPDWAQACFR